MMFKLYLKIVYKIAKTDKLISYNTKLRLYAPKHDQGSNQHTTLNL